MKPNRAVIIAIGAVAISVASVVLVLCRVEPIEADWAAVLVAVLALIVMAVVGVNVYSIFDMNKMRREFEDLRRSLNDNLLAFSKDLDKTQQKNQAHYSKIYDIITSSQTNMAIRLNEWDSAATLWALCASNPYNSNITDDFADSALGSLKIIYNCDHNLQIDYTRYQTIERNVHQAVIKALQRLVPVSLDAAIILVQLTKEDPHAQQQPMS
jgi:hypothetical protein